MVSLHRKRRAANHQRERGRIERTISNISDGDIHDANLELPHKVYILASGPNGLDAYESIPEDAFIIAVNRGAAICLDHPSLRSCEPSVWLVADWRATQQPYWKEVTKVFKGIKVFSEETLQKECHFEHGQAEAIYTFELIPKSHMIEVFEPPSKRFKPDGSVTGAALWFAFLKGAKHIVLCGADMGGDADYVGKLPKDWRHGETWIYRKVLDGQIKWMQERGILVETISRTKLENPRPVGPAAQKQPPEPTVKSVMKARHQSYGNLEIKRSTGRRQKRVDHKLPSVSYMTMAFQPQNTIHAVINALLQNYPNELKTLHLLYQPPYPHQLKHDLPIKIVEYQVRGTWPQLWLRKFLKFLNGTEDQVGIIWDEDDRYDNDYTISAITKMYRKNATVVWNPEMIFCRSAKMKHEIMRPPYGTMVFKTQPLRNLIGNFLKDYPNECAKAKRGVDVPLDGYLCNYLKQTLPNKEIAVHSGKRFYFFHSNSNSFMNGHRSIPEDNLDYGK